MSTHTQRKIGLHHFALYRGWLQGVELDALANLYLETGLDLRVAKSTLNWVKDTIRQAAIRHGRYGEARLLRIRLGVGDGGAGQPDLEEFRQEFDPSNFYSESELLAEYLQAYPSQKDPSAAKRQRLRQRQLDAVLWLEKLVATDPVRQDLVSAWFDKNVANRLILADIGTLGELMDLIASRGYRWFVAVPKLGEKGAARLVKWLQSYEKSLGPVTTSALVPQSRLTDTMRLRARPLATGIVPFEYLKVPVELDGAFGENRLREDSALAARNDKEAIEAWILSRAGSLATERDYRREAERLILWALLERGKALSSLTVEDCLAYKEWLTGLGRTPEDQWPFRLPQSDWMAKRGTPKYSPAWRPFEGVLAPSSVRQALVKVHSLFAWLTAAKYLKLNPFMMVSKKVHLEDERRPVEATPVFPRRLWEFTMDVLHSLETTEDVTRKRFIMEFAYMTGMRGAELVSCQLGHFYAVPNRDGDGYRWMLRVYGKGRVQREIPITPPILVIVGEYLQTRGLDPNPLNNPPRTPMFVQLRGEDKSQPGVIEKPIGYSMLYKICKGIFDDCAARMRLQGKELDAQLFERASTHWIRHTRAADLGRKGAKTPDVQKLLGHKNPATTAIYTEPAAEDFYEAFVELDCA